MTDWPKGTRLRCINNLGIESGLTVGKTYTVKYADSQFAWLFDCDDDHGGVLSRGRFKPIVRVKAPTIRILPRWRRDMHIFATAGR